MAHAVDLTTQEWMLIREAVSAHDGGSTKRNEWLAELHKKLLKAAEHKQVLLMVNTDKR
jgi:hypothetical protein